MSLEQCAGVVCPRPAKVVLQRLFGIVLCDRCREYIHQVEPAPPRAHLSHLQRGVPVLGALLSAVTGDHLQ